VAIQGVDDLLAAQTPHLNSRELCARFGVSQRACAAKTREIRQIFDIVQLDPR
jgi:hypothetical protein